MTLPKKSRTASLAFPTDCDIQHCMRLVFDPETNEFTTYNRSIMEERFSKTSSTIAGSEHLSGTALAKIRSTDAAPTKFQNELRERKQKKKG